jgi:NADH:ubiquinone oxidoreductase subunit 5 (subunit L)/multisubunit Na+/H+ antiporter MnhA subunit
VAQVGYMLLGIGTGTAIGVIGGVFHMVNHAVYKACLFLGAGSVERETGTADLGRLGGLARTMPVTFACMFVSALAISGIPPLSGFVSKWLVYESLIEIGSPLLFVVALFGSALTLALFVKVLHSVFFGPRPRALERVHEGEGGIGMAIAMLSLAALSVGLGLFAPWVVGALVGPAVGTAGEAEGAMERASAIAPIAGLLLLGFLGGVVLAFLGQIRTRRVRPVFVGGQVLDPDRNRFPGPEFYRTLADLPALGPLLRAGERGQFDPYVVVERFGRPVVSLLRRLHRGVLMDYVVWCLLGFAVLVLVLGLGR